MSHKNVIDFLAYLKSNPDFAKQLESTESPEARAELMKAKGFVFSQKDMLEVKNALIKKFPDQFASAELSDDELNAASGAGCGWTHESEGHCGWTHESEMICAKEKPCDSA